MRGARSNSERMVYITVTLEGETLKAWLVNDGVREVWVPKSQCNVTPEGNVSSLSIPEWLAKEKDLI